MTDQGKPVPVPTAETRHYWTACREGVLSYQYCLACRRPQFYPRTLCVGCGGGSLEWRASRGLGTVHAVTVVHRPPTAAFRAEVPYAIALVDLDEGFLRLAAEADIVFWPMVVDAKRKDLEALPDESLAAALVSGAVRTSEQEEMVRLLRRKARVLVAHGACASTIYVDALAAP
ncbi:MAG: OB-fold domain-containing protein, partial [candidate division NC10 bacterium]